MQHLYYCPQCRAPIAPLQRFCGNCGTRLQPVAQWNSTDVRPMPVPNRSDFISPHNIGMEDAAGQVNATMPAGKNTKPLRREILKLLSSLIENQSINN